MFVPVGSAGLGNAQMSVMLAQRGSMRAAREVEDETVDRQFNAEREKATQQITQMENQIVAAKHDFFSFLSGAVMGFVTGVAGAMMMPLAAPVIGVLPSMQAAATFLVHLPTALAAGTAAGFGAGQAIQKAWAPVTTVYKNAASDAELRVFELEREVAKLETTARDAAGDADQARRGVQQSRGALSELRQYQRDLDDAHARGDGNAVSVSSEHASPELREAMKGVRKEAQLATKDARFQHASAEQLQLAALEKKRAAIEERKSNEMTRSIIGVFEVGLDIAAKALSGGASEVLLNLAGSGAGFASSLVTDEDARAADREAETLRMMANKAEGDAGESRERVSAIQEEQSRAAAAAKKASTNVKSGTVVAAGAGGSGNIATAQLLAELAEGEERDAKIDRRGAREGRMQHEKAAIEQRRAADDEQSDAEFGHMLSAGIGVLLSAGNLIDGAPRDKMSDWDQFAKIGGAVSSAGDAAHKFYRSGEENEARRSAERLDLLAGIADNAEKDAKDVQDEAKERRRRMLDLAVAAGRGQSLA